ncbi:hypothetical protein [Streptomyces sp. NPDC059209]|uniref:hypothetical protein n=1 Tax=Streptomyces sp. NPDC059209 TaxID=3346769 RepID=UPI003681F9F8
MMSRLHARLRSFRALMAVVAVTTLLSAAPPAYAEERESPRESPRAAPSPSPSASSSLAGNQAGQGRPRPGRTTVSAEASPPGDLDSSVDSLLPDLPDLPTLPSASGRPSSGSASPSAGRSASPSAEPGNGKSSGKKSDRETDGEPEREGGQDDEDVLSEDFGSSTDVPFPLRTPPLDATGRERNDQAVSQPVARAVPALTLGIGMALMGLGIGFLGVRLRRH